jgi:hypothetical protein
MVCLLVIPYLSGAPGLRLRFVPMLIPAGFYVVS